MSMEAGAARVAVHRIRKRYHALRRKEIAHILSDPAMFEKELVVLLSAFG
jgi:hypothetical protein